MYDIIVILRYIYWHIDFKLILHIHVVSKIKEEIKRHIGKTVIKDTALLL